MSKYDITFESKSAIKSHPLAKLLVELSLPTTVELSEKWVLFVYGSSNLKGNGTGIL